MLSALYKREATMDPKDLGPKKGETSQKLMDVLKGHLAFLARRGEIDFPINEQTMEYFRALGDEKEVPPELTEKFLQTARRALLERRLATTVRDIPRAFYTFGHLIREIRTRAEVAVQEIAQVLGESALHVQEVESGKVDPLTLEPSVISDIMILYSLAFGMVEKAIRVDATQRTVGDSFGSGLGRVPMGVSKEKMAKEVAQEDLTYHLAKSKGQEAHIPGEFLESIQTELRKKGREDLLVKASE